MGANLGPPPPPKTKDSLPCPPATTSKVSSAPRPRPSQGERDAEGAGVNYKAKSNPFLSPHWSEGPSTDYESGSSSGQDEFHLERYSQDAKVTQQRDRILQQQSSSNDSRGRIAGSKRRKPPGLNIITDFPEQQARACTDGVVIEKVQARKVQPAPNRARSIVSVKPERGYESPPREGGLKPSLVTLKDLVEMRKAKMANRAASRDNDQKMARRAVNTGRSMGTELRIPNHEVLTQKRSMNGDGRLSVHTPTTPVIIVTPAQDGVEWSSTTTTIPRPASSIYTVVTTAENPKVAADVIPPVPALSRRLGKSGKGYSDAKLPSKSASGTEWWDSQDSNENSDDELHRQASHPYLTRRGSSESQEQILSADEDTARPKSQGWWNLMLSPMLSRAGTLKSRGPVADFQIPVPPLPAMIDKRRSKSVTLASEMSPGTPRRLGLANPRASTWSRWTSWENERAGAETTRGALNEPEDQSRNPGNRESGLTVPFMVAPSMSGDGLAAEYYHACAIEQRTGTAYYECQNHSCAEKLPALHSVFDKKLSSEADAEMGMVKGTVTGTAVEVTTPTHMRSFSNSTNAKSEPEELSPNVRHANTAAVFKARALDSTKMSAEGVRVAVGLGIDDGRSASTDGSAPKAAPSAIPSPPRSDPRYPNIAAIVPPQPSQTNAGTSIASPGPVSPDMHRKMASRGAVPMTEISRDPPQPTGWPMAVQNQSHVPATEGRGTAPPHIEVYNLYQNRDVVLPKASDKQDSAESNGEDNRKKRSFTERLKCGRRKPKPQASTTSSRKRRWLISLIALLLFLMVAACVVLATQLTRGGDKTPVQSQWLNLTGYPPMPTGISTIIRPDHVQEQSQCVQPSTLWSCALPKEDQADVTPNGPDQPNFRFEIKFRNGTVPSNMTLPVTSSTQLSRRSLLLRNLITPRANDPFTNDLFTPDPTPPSRADQLFMGNTTDNTTTPFDGEATPFFITFIPAFPIDPSAATNSSTATATSRRLLQARQSSNLTSIIPPPDVLADGSAAPANLLPTSPFPTSQPILLYNRGLPDEHYGFYMYYDKAIFLSSAAVLNSSSGGSNDDALPADQSGGSLRTAAAARCTFSQTRFRVQMFTSTAFNGHLLVALNNTANSATNFSPPGSFPYPATLTLDRHGGNINKKAVYCYGVDRLQVIQQTVNSIVTEQRGIGGNLINAAPGLIAGGGFDQNAGGIDGGTGGCGCAWQNWR